MSVDDAGKGFQQEQIDKSVDPLHPGMPVYSIDDLQFIPEEEWQEFKKKVTTRMVRIDGPFQVRTSEGMLTCQDGWLAVDARGYPYPIDVDEQSLIYDKVRRQSGQL